MKKSVNLYFCNEDTAEKIKAIKEAGYDEFYTGCYDAKESVKFREQLEMAKALGMKCTMIHCSYYEPNLNYFWEESELGDKVEHDYINQIRMSKGLSNDFVVHLNGGFGSKQTQIGLDRIKRILKVCDECNINLCIENLYSDKELPYIFSNIHHPKLKICFDIGHRNFLTPNLDVMKEFGEYVTVLHLHDNDGKKDLHQMPYTATINWEAFAKQLTKHPNLVLASEIKYLDQDMQLVLAQNLKALEKLDRTVSSVKNSDVQR